MKSKLILAAIAAALLSVAGCASLKITPAIVQTSAQGLATDYLSTLSPADQALVKAYGYPVAQAVYGLHGAIPAPAAFDTVISLAPGSSSSAVKGLVTKVEGFYSALYGSVAKLSASTFGGYLNAIAAGLEAAFAQPAPSPTPAPID